MPSSDRPINVFSAIICFTTERRLSTILKNILQYEIYSESYVCERDPDGGSFLRDEPNFKSAKCMLFKFICDSFEISNTLSIVQTWTHFLSGLANRLELTVRHGAALLWWRVFGCESISWSA